MALEGDGKSEVGATEGILESHVAPAAPAFQHHTLGDQEPFCRQRKASVRGGHAQPLLSALCWFLQVTETLMGRLSSDFPPYAEMRQQRAREHKCLTQTPEVPGGDVGTERTRCQPFCYVSSVNVTTLQ